MNTPAHPFARKRKASQSSPIQEPRRIPQEEAHPNSTPAVVTSDVDCALLHGHEQTQPVVAIPTPSSSERYDVDAETHRPKRPRLSLASPAPRTRRATPSRKRASPRPKPSPSPHIRCSGPWAHDSNMSVKTGYRLHLHRRPSLPSNLLSPLAESPVTPNPGAVPASLLPTITRDTLRELDLDAILRNPQLRHDLLFDPGLQFRPTTGRRKQLAAERYWAAVARELERGCTCTSWDAAGVLQACGCGAMTASSSSCSGGPAETVSSHPDAAAARKDGAWTDRFADKAKRTRPPTPPPWSDRYAAYLEAAADPRLDDAGRSNAHTPEGDKESDEEGVPFQIRVPSRVGPMLQELIAVLECVIVPPPLPAAHAASSLPPRSTLPPSSSDAHNLLAHLDPTLIEQELRRDIFDPAGLFGVVGDTLKRHCAPMRDQLVDTMVGVARGSEGTVTRRAVRSIRMCFEILELMKLDIANHQLQHLRPFLAASTPDFELRVFVERCRRGIESPRFTREWLQRAWAQTRAGPLPADMKMLSASAEMTLNGAAPTIPRAPALPRRTLVQLSLINAITGLVFNPPSHTYSSHGSSTSLPHPSTPGYPETLYLDTARVALLAADAADLTALYMLLMLWRQLVFWKPSGGENRKDGEVFPRYARVTPRLDDWEVDRVKREIWEVGPRRIGSCFFFSDEGELPEASGGERVKWTHAMQNVALQIAMRAEEARTRPSSGPAPVPVPAPTATRQPPSQEALGLMSGWIQSHLRRDSVLADRLRELLRQEVADAVTRLTFATGVEGGTVPGSDGAKSSGCAPGSGGGTAGLEPLMPEIRHLAQRLAKLVLVNMRVYWSLYEAEGFLVDEVP